MTTPLLVPDSSAAETPVGDLSAPSRRFSRRKLLRGMASAAATAVGSGTLLSLFGERNYLKAYRVTIRLPQLPPALEGYTICQLSDLHRGPVVGEAHVRRAVALANALAAHLIVVTGDFVSDSARYAASCGRAVADLRARDGVFGVLGNHDYWTGDIERVAAAVEHAGVRLLTNRSVTIGSGESRWSLCGLDDCWSGAPSLEASLAESASDDFRILLCHEPDYVDVSGRYGFPLQLSGHSHGGQCILPGGAPLITPYLGHRYPYGLRRAARWDTLVYTNVGVGVIFPPIRINCRPEVTHITLRRAAA
jgi:hypothetical protein